MPPFITLSIAAIAAVVIGTAVPAIAAGLADTDNGDGFWLKKRFYRPEFNI